MKTFTNRKRIAPPTKTRKVKMCDCGFPQSNPKPHQHSLPDKPQHTPTPWYTDSEWGFHCPNQNHDAQDVDTKIFEAETVANAAFIVTAVNAHEIYETTLRRIAERDKGQAGFEARQALGIKDDEKNFQRWKKARAEGK